MRHASLLVLVLGGALTAQTSQFGIFPINPSGPFNGTCTTFTSRGTLGANPGDVLLEVPGTHFSGVCQDAAGSGTLFNSFFYQTQDQNAATVEPYSMLVRSAAFPGPGPDCTAAGIRMQVTGLSTPGGAGTIQWAITTTLATPSTALPLCETWFMGAEVAPAPNWPADGQSFHIANHYLTQGLTGGNPAPNAPSLAWNCVAGTANQPDGRTIRFYVNSPASVLTMANVDPTLAAHCLATAPAPYTNTDTGAGGLWPQCQGTGARNDGLKARVVDASAPGGFYVVFLGTPVGCPGLPVPALFQGALYLNPTALVQVASGSLDAAGTTIADVLPAGFDCRPALNRFVPFQAFTLRSNLAFPGKVTNSAAVNYRP